MGCGVLFFVVAGFFFWPFWILAIVLAIAGGRK